MRCHVNEIRIKYTQRERKRDEEKKRRTKKKKKNERKSVVKSKVSSNLLCLKYLYVKFIPILFIVL